MKKRILSLLLCLVTALSLLPTAVFAANGSAGDVNIAFGDGWRLDAGGCLHITGAVHNEPTRQVDNWIHTYKTVWDDCKSQITSVVAEPGSSIDNCESLLSYCENLVSVDLRNLDTSRVATMEEMFYNCKSLKSVDLSRLDTSNVTNMKSMFEHCIHLTSVTLRDPAYPGGFNTDNVTNMKSMFEDCFVLPCVDFNGLNLSNVLYTENMFLGCYNLYRLDVSNLPWAGNDILYECLALHEVSGNPHAVARLSTYLMDIGKFILSREGYYDPEVKHWEDVLTGKVYQTRRELQTDLHSSTSERVELHLYNGYLIHFDPCGGTYDSSDIDVSYTTTDSRGYPRWPRYVIHPENPTRDGAYFKGWYTEPVGGECLANPQQSLRVDQDCTVYAHWGFITTSGGISDTQRWDLDSEGTLHIWKPYVGLGEDIRGIRDQIKSVIVEEGASISNTDGFFKDCKNLVSADLRFLWYLDDEQGSAVDMFTGCVSLKELTAYAPIVKDVADQLFAISDYWIDPYTIDPTGVWWDGPMPTDPKDMYQGTLTSAEQLRTHQTYNKYVWELLRYTPEDLKITVTQTEDKTSADVNWTNFPHRRFWDPLEVYYEVQLLRYIPSRDNYAPSGDVKTVTGNPELTFDPTDFALSAVDGENRWRVSVKVYAVNGVLLTENISSAFNTGLRFLKNPAPTLDPDGLLHWDPVPNANQYTVELKDQNFSTVKTLTMSDTEIDLFEFMNDGEMYYCYVTAFDTTGKYLASDSVRTEHVVCQNCEFYNIWIGSTPITDRNKDDVLGNGTVRFYPAGEYTGVSLDDQSTFGDRYPTLVLDNFNMTGDAFHTDGAKAAQIYIDSDVNIVLKGTNSLYRYGNANGIYIANGRYVWFYGIGTLNVDTSWNDYDALVGASPALIFHDSVKVNLTGACALRCVYDPHNGDNFMMITDHAKVRCFSKQTAAGRDYPAIITADLDIYDDGWLICESQYNCEALNSWGVPFSNNDYDIEILKLNEYQYDGYTPYKPENGVDVPGGVYSWDCRYLSVHAGATPEADPVPVSTVNIAGLKLPVAGEKAGENLMSIYPATEGYFIYEAVWVCLEDYYEMLPDDAFEAGKSYALGVGVSPKKGFTLSESTPFVFNGGETAAWDDIKNITDDGLYGFTQILEVAEPERIALVNITGMKEPEVGEKVSENIKSLAAASEHYSINQVFWARIDDNFDVYEMRPNDVFEAGRKYVLGVSVAAERGYALSEDTAFTFNGGDIAAWDDPKNLYEGLLNGFTQIYEIGTIDKVAVDMKIPVVGAKVGDFLITSGDPRYSFEYVVWSELSNGHNGHLDENDVFKAGNSYYLLFNVVPAAGYAVTKDTAVTINGGSVQSYVVYSNGILSCNSFVVDPVEKPSVLLGDVNGDGALSILDVTALLLEISKPGSPSAERMAICDVNGDGALSILDVSALLLML